LDAESKIFIQKSILQKKLEHAWSDIIDYENKANLFEERKNGI